MITIHPYWAHLVESRLLSELAALGATVEVNEDGLMRATWPAGVEEIQSSVIVKLELLPVAQHGKGWVAIGDIYRQGRRFVMTRQLKGANGK